VVLTADGLISVSEFTQVDRAAGARANISDRIKSALVSDVAAYGSLAGWQVITVPALQRIIVNVPLTSTTARQYVLNTKGGAWCRYTGINARCWGLFGDRLMWGGQGKVYQAETGEDDDGTAISWAWRSAFNGFGDAGRVKDFGLLRPVTSGNDDAFMVGVDVDYGDEEPASESDGAAWAGVSGYGRVGAIRGKGTGGAGKRFSAFNLMFQAARGAVL